MPNFFALLLCLVAGAITPFAIEPYSYWYLGIITIAIFAWLIHQPLTSKQILLRAFLFGLGYFGVGVSWVFVSIYHFGSASFILALLMTTLFVVFVAAVFSLPFYLLNRITFSYWRLLLGFPLLWALSEWLRSWLLTGFPWLYLGYGHIDTQLAGWAPIGGVIFVSLLSVFTSVVLVAVTQKNVTSQVKWLAAIAVVIIWTEGKSLASVQWTEKTGEDITVGIVQPNIPQEKKWAPDFREPTLTILNTLSEDLWKNDWVIWPEAAIPDLFHRSQDYIDKIDQKARDNNSSLITGILYDHPDHYAFYNSLLGLGNAEGIYFKQRLVPFGEYVPLESWLRGLIDFFNLPTSIITAGNNKQNNLHAKGINIAGAICYEIVYPDLIAELAQDAQVIVTVSNDAWFGQSVGPKQHFHMARMRAIETGRYVIRSTNNGVSAIIEPNGNIQQQSEQFVRTSLSGTIVPLSGNTPYMIWRNYFLLILMMGMSVVLLIIQKKTSPDQQPDHN